MICVDDSTWRTCPMNMGVAADWSLDNVNENYPDRFALFLNIDFEQLDDDGWPQEQLTMMEEARKKGVKGLRVFKGEHLSDPKARTNDGASFSSGGESSRLRFKVPA